MTLTRPLARTRQGGFSLVESLIATVVVAFGLLAVTGMQITLTRSADLARQRGEAARLAEERMEALRAFSVMKTTTGRAAWADLANGSDSVSSNATYTRNWTVANAATDPMRRVSVSVSWTDRSNQVQSVTLNSVISRTDPADVGSLGFPLPENTTLKRPKNRNLNIPVPALDLGGGKSVYQLANNFAVVFSNDSGYVVKKCDFVVTTAEQLTSCTAYDAYIVAGYVSKTMTAFPAGLAMNSASLTGYDASSGHGVQCTMADAQNQNSTGTVIAGYKYYLCVVSVVAGNTWGGTLRLAGMASGTNYLVCRFEYAAVSGVSANQRNVQPYVSVSESLDNQNFIIATAATCPSVCGLQSVVHQDCRASNGSRTTVCPAT